MANRLRVTELDFDTIKNNLKTFLNQQSEFSDYDFEGSGLNILLDILAYNTHYNAYYLNMVANESFLDTALLRSSAVSHAKLLNYIPYSATAPKAIINFTVVSGITTPGTMTIPAGYNFLSELIDGKSYGFVVNDDVTVTKSNDTYYFENLEIYEGQRVSYVFNYNQNSNPKQIFILPDDNIDTRTLRVVVSPSSTSSLSTKYNIVTDILDVESTSEVFFLEENLTGKYQISFGNDVVGKKLPDGSVVTATYIITNGDVANKANNFLALQTIVDSLGYSISNFTVTPVFSASGGAPKESVDSIRFSAPSQFATQNRLVTFKDYETYILNSYPNVGSISVWGGEDNNPPVYGTVFVSMKPKNNYYLSEVEKQRIIDEIITPKAIVSTKCIIRDPAYLYLVLENEVQYNPNKTTDTEESLINIIRNSILSYSNTNLNKFSAKFVLSKLQDVIDSSQSNSIIGSKTNVRVQKRFLPSLAETKTYVVEFNVPLHRGGINDRMISSQFDVLDALGVRRTVSLEEIQGSYTGISSIAVTNPGTGYLTTPTVTITGDGVGATAEAVVVNGAIESIKITNRGINYSRAIVTITDTGSGYGATAVATIDSRYGVIRTIYYDSNAQKQIVNSEVGTIDYDTGVVTINAIKILSVSTTDNYLRLSFESDKGIITTARDTIITIDEEDPVSIVTKLEVSYN
jgi:hypothetical protein